MRNALLRSSWIARPKLFAIAAGVALATAGVLIAYAQATIMAPPAMVPGAGAAIALSWETVSPVGANATTYTLSYDVTNPFTATQTIVTTNVSATINGVDGRTYYAIVQADDGSHVLSAPSAVAQATADGRAPVSTFTATPASPNGLNSWYTTVPTAMISIVETNTGLQSFAVNSVDVSADPALTFGLPPDPSTYVVPAPGQGINSYSFRATDVAGNIESLKTASIKLDSVVPTCAIVVSSGTVNVSAGDPTPGSGVDHIESVFLALGSAPNGSTVWTSTPGSSLTTTAPGGRPVLFARSVDAAGNVSTVQQENTPGPSTTLLTSPASPTGPSGSWLHAPSITLVATGTAPLTTYYSWNNTGTVATAGNAPVVPTGPGVQTLRYFSVDGVPVTETTHTATFYVLDQQSFTITPLAGPHGSMLPSAPLVLTGGTSTVVTITPDSGYHITDVLVDGVSVGATTSVAFNIVAANHTVAATFAINTFTITPSAGAHGSISPAVPPTVDSGANQSFTFTPDSGYHVGDVLVDGVSVGAPSSYTFTSVTANHTIAVTFSINTYTITPSAGVHGSISPTVPQTVTSGANQSFSFTPDSGYQVGDVLVDGLSVGAPSSYTFTSVTANHTIAVTFSLTPIPTFTITPSAGAHGSISPATAQTVTSGANQSFTFTPDSGYHVGDVLVDGLSVGAPPSYTFTSVTANHTIAVTFSLTPEPTFTITPSAGAHGSISPATAQTVNSGANQSFTFTPDSGYHVGDVLVDGLSVGAPPSYTFTSVTANHTIAVTFSLTPEPTFTITPSAGAHGSISPATAQTVNSGANQSFTFTPDSGYHVGDVLVDGLSVGAPPSYTFTSVTANHTIAVTFSLTPEPTFTITPSAGAHGSISPATAQTVNSGANQSFTFTPDSGYHVGDVLVDGLSVGAPPSYTFTSVTANHTIAVTFSANVIPSTFTITVTAGAGGTSTWLGVNTVSAGSNLSLSFTPDPGYHVAGIVVDGGAPVATFSGFTNITANHTVAVTFTRTMLPLGLTIKADRTISTRGHAVAFSGNTSPNVPNGTKLSFFIRKMGSTTWTRLSVRGTFSSNRWSYTLSTSNRAHGAYFFRVRYAGSSYLPSVSRTVKVSIK